MEYSKKLINLIERLESFEIDLKEILEEAKSDGFLESKNMYSKKFSKYIKSILFLITALVFLISIKYSLRSSKEL